MSKELLNVKWHKIQSCWCENLSSKILIFVKKSQVFVKLDGLNYKWSQPWTEISSVTFFISTSKKTSTASFLYKLFLIYHCTLIKYFVETKRLAVEKKTVSFLLCNSFSQMLLIISKNRETIIENKRAIDIFWWPGQITKIEPKRYLFFPPRVTRWLHFDWQICIKNCQGKCEFFPSWLELYFLNTKLHFQFVLCNNHSLFVVCTLKLVKTELLEDLKNVTSLEWA